MTREASVATLRRLAEALDDQWGELPTAAQRQRLSECMKAYRSEIAPLRTRAEIDADIAALTRQCVDDEWAGDDDYAKWEKITALCREETSSGSSSADAEEVPSPRPPASPAGADYSLAEPGLYEWKHVPRALWESLGHELTHNDRYHHLRPDLIKAIQAVLVAAHSSGPTGAVAAKESTDNAAAPEGAALERECNCDQALHLEKRIGDAVRAIRRSNTIPAGLLHELLGILEGEA